MSKKKSTALAVVAVDLVPVQTQLLTQLALCTTETLERLGAIREEARLTKKQHDEARKAEKQPHLDGGREVDNRYRPILELCDKIVEGCDERLNAHVAAQRAEQARVLADNTMNVAEKHYVLTALAQPELPPQVRMTLTFTAEVVSPEDVPREWLVFDQARADQFYKDTCGTGTIPGVRCVRTEGVRTR